MTERPPRDPAVIARLALVVAAALYLSRYLFQRRTWTLLDEGILAIHEAGHVLFQPFGEFLMVLGGSILQVVVPLLFVFYFLRRADRFAAAVVLFWVAASLFNLATYVADARAGELPLLSGNRADHDWTWLLIQVKLLDHDLLLGRIVRFVGLLCYLGAVLGGLHYASAVKATAQPRPTPGWQLPPQS